MGHHTVPSKRHPLQPVAISITLFLGVEEDPPLFLPHPTTFPYSTSARALRMEKCCWKKTAGVGLLAQQRRGSGTRHRASLRAASWRRAAAAVRLSSPITARPRQFSFQLPPEMNRADQCGAARHRPLSCGTDWTHGSDIFNK